ncbi:MAG: tRNA 2-thiouridine(34) synthase MnmA [Candidatus Omnitrophica bacterium]|nr:tRNA 2-thiouridine(34) synthase MnmA [Candidatus Omnitrophota bacterium]
MSKKELVVVAMSGGVDSSVSAGLLKQKGYEVIGITLCFNLKGACNKGAISCGYEGIEEAKKVADKLGIPHYVLNMQKDLEEKVIKEFCSEYLKGRTPNPCVRCNQFIKFDILLKKALAMGARYLATGHYARIVFNRNYFLLKKAIDKTKDQSYFLYRLNQRQLKNIIFPLGNYKKAQVKDIAKKFGLGVAERPSSQEICFLCGKDYRQFLKERLRDKECFQMEEGLIVDKQGNSLGRHKGIAFYTIGQRQGLGIAKGYPLYIIHIDAEKNLITVGTKKDVYKKEFLLKEPNFILNLKKNKIVAKVKIRYNHREALADLEFYKDKIRVCFRKPQFAITPGQSAVFYDKDTVLGGGIIDTVIG